MTRIIAGRFGGRRLAVPADARVQVEWSGGRRTRQDTTVSLAPATGEQPTRSEAVARLIAAARDGRVEYVADRLLVSGPAVVAAVLADLPDELRGPLSQLVARLDAYRDRVAAELEGATVVEGPDAAEVLAAFDLVVTTMGRGPGDDPAFFAAAAAAGEWAAAAVRQPENPDN